MERPIGYIDDYDTWSDAGCEKLALAVAAAKGRQYAMIYAAWKKAKSNNKKDYYRALLNGIENFLEKSFVGAFVDSEEILAAIRYRVDRDLRVKSND